VGAVDFEADFSSNIITLIFFFRLKNKHKIAVFMHLLLISRRKVQKI